MSMESAQSKSVTKRFSTSSNLTTLLTCNTLFTVKGTAGHTSQGCREKQDNGYKSTLNYRMQPVYKKSSL